MNNQVLPVGSRVCVISYSPFRGLIGTIRTVDTIPDLEADEAFCFYLVELEGTHIKGCHIDFCVTMYNEKALNPIQTWLPGFSAMCRYTTFGMAS